MLRILNFSRHEFDNGWYPLPFKREDIILETVEARDSDDSVCPLKMVSVPFGTKLERLGRLTPRLQVENLDW